MCVADTTRYEQFAFQARPPRYCSSALSANDHYCLALGPVPPLLETKVIRAIHIQRNFRIELCVITHRVNCYDLPESNRLYIGQPDHWQPQQLGLGEHAPSRQ